MVIGERHETADGWLLRTQLAARPESVPEARRLVRGILDALDADPDVAANILLAVSEAAANAVVHAYETHQSGVFDVGVRHGVTGAVEVVVRDYGHGLGTPRRPGMGLGLLLMQRLADGCRVGAAAPGVVVRLTFAVARSPG